jgi:hypothetical protein
MYPLLDPEGYKLGFLHVIQFLVLLDEDILNSPSLRSEYTVKQHLIEAHSHSVDY